MVSDWILDLKRTKSVIYKQRIIERALIAYRLGSSSAECFLYNCYLAYNPSFQYELTTVIKTSNLTYKSNPWTKFWGVLEMLRTHSLNKSKLSMIVNKETSPLFDSVEWNLVCRPVILKDLNCGIDANILNTVLGNTEWRIPE